MFCYPLRIVIPIYPKWTFNYNMINDRLIIYDYLLNSDCLGNKVTESLSYLIFKCLVFQGFRNLVFVFSKVRLCNLFNNRLVLIFSNTFNNISAKKICHEAVNCVWD